MTSAFSRAEVTSRPDTQSASWPFQIAINIDLRQSSTAHLTGLQAPAVLGVHASLDHVATAVVSVWIAGGIRIIAVRIVVSVVVIVAVRVEAEAETSAIMKSTAVESTTTKSASVETTAIMESASHAATMESARYTAAMETASSEAATAKAATMETATATHAAAVKTATTAAKATAAPVAASTPATSTATSPRHRWRNQANGRNCQQCDNCLTQHDHSPSQIYRSQPGPGFAGGNRFGESLSASTSPLLNSPRATPD
jgi:hypothetical protein